MPGNGVRTMPDSENFRGNQRKLQLMGFNSLTAQELKFAGPIGFSMSEDDLKFCQTYFRNTEKENLL